MGRYKLTFFNKPTDSKQYLLHTSCHPKHTRNSIPYNLARRLKTIVSDEITLHKRLEELEEFVIKRKYPLSLIEDAFQKTKSLDRSKLLNTKDTTEGTNIISYVTTLNPQNPEIYTDIIQLKSILHRNEELLQCSRNKTFLKSKRQPPNLKRLLTKAKFTMKQTEECSVKKCNEPRCGLCKYIREGSTVKFKNKSCKVNENISCKAKNVIYIIQCRGCDEQYIGKQIICGTEPRYTISISDMKL